MDIDKLSSMVLRVFFFGAFLVLILAVLENSLNFLFSRSIRGFLPFVAAPSTMLGWSSILLFFVIAILLRQIREVMKTS